MNKKIILWLCGFVLLLVLLLFFVRIQQQIEQQDALIQNLIQSNAALNDTVVAIQRQSEAADPAASDLTQPANSSLKQAQQAQLRAQAQSDHKALIRSKLELVQFALSQQQYVYALEQLKQTSNMLSQQNFSPAVKLSLQRSLKLDEQNIRLQLSRWQQQQEEVLSILNKADLQLQILAQQTPRVTVAQTPWWQNWLQISRIDTAPPQLMLRQNQYMMLQWRLQLAQQALINGQNTMYSQQLDLAVAALQPFADGASRDLLKRLQQLQDQPLLRIPPLQSLVLVR